MKLPERFEDYDVTDADGKISLKELMGVTGTVENAMEAFASFDRDGKSTQYFVIPVVSTQIAVSSENTITPKRIQTQAMMVVPHFKRPFLDLL